MGSPSPLGRWARAIRLYTRSMYLSLNQYLCGNPVAPIQELIDGFDDGLSRLPAYAGIVVRFVNLEGDPGDSVCYPEYLSTSKAKNWAEKWPWETTKYKLIIASKNGRVLGDLASEPSEEEVLFRHGSCFHVTKKYRSGAQTIIEMTE